MAWCCAASFKYEDQFAYRGFKADASSAAMALWLEVASTPSGAGTPVRIPSGHSFVMPVKDTTSCLTRNMKGYQSHVNVELESHHSWLFKMYESNLKSLHLWKDMRETSLSHFFHLHKHGGHQHHPQSELQMLQLPLHFDTLQVHTFQISMPHEALSDMQITTRLAESKCVHNLIFL